MSGRRSKTLRAHAYGQGLPAAHAARLYRLLKRVWTASRSTRQIHVALEVSQLIGTAQRRSA